MHERIGSRKQNTAPRETGRVGGMKKSPVKRGETRKYFVQTLGELTKKRATDINLASAKKITSFAGRVGIKN